MKEGWVIVDFDDCLKGNPVVATNSIKYGFAWIQINGKDQTYYYFWAYVCYAVLRL